MAADQTVKEEEETNSVQPANAEMDSLLMKQFYTVPMAASTTAIAGEDSVYIPSSLLTSSGPPSTASTPSAKPSSAEAIQSSPESVGQPSVVIENVAQLDVTQPLTSSSRYSSPMVIDSDSSDGSADGATLKKKPTKKQKRTKTGSKATKATAVKIEDGSIPGVASATRPMYVCMSCLCMSCVFVLFIFMIILFYFIFVIFW